MNRNFLTFVLLFFAFLHVFAQNLPRVNLAHLNNSVKENRPEKAYLKVSPHTALLLRQLKHSEASKTGFSVKQREQFLFRTAHGVDYVSGMIRVSKDYNAANLERRGVLIGTRAGNVWTLKIPLNQLAAIVEENDYEYLQIDEPVKANMETAVSYTQVDKVHRGEDLILPVKGENVVVGIVDFGFDYTHPLFYSSDGENYRIKRVWIQDGEGTAPEGFDYGAEYIDEEQILEIGFDLDHMSHGTHVASIATGSGFRNSRYTGVAPSAELVFVTPQNGNQDDFISTGQSNIVDAINYVFQYAASVHKPAVVNLSLGTHIGPHDGTSLFDQAVDNLTGTGRIVVGAAGNEGMMNMHIENNFSERPSFSTFFNYNGAGIIGFIDSWGEPGMDYCFSVAMVNQNGTVISETETVCAGENTEEEFDLAENEEALGARIQFFTSESEFNEKPRILIYFENLSGNLLLLNATGSDGTMHMWNVGTGRGADFVGTNDNGVIGGNNQVTVGEIGGTGKSMISVGAFTTRNSFQNLLNRWRTQNTTVGDIAPFSSRGPAADNRIKPDLTAPGNVVVAAVNSFDVSISRNSPHVADEMEHEGRTYYFAAFEGTSMSSPMVTGMVALMLEVNPLLNPETVKSLLQESSKEDGFTGATPGWTWGYGKMDALKTIQNTAVATGTNLSEKISLKSSYLIYPNPSKGDLFVASFSGRPSGRIRMELVDLQGKIIVSANIEKTDPDGKWSYSLPDIRNGIYMLRISDGHKTEQQKLIIYK